jgi:hypothetical protein
LQPEHIQLIILSRSEAPLYRTVEPLRDGQGLTCTCPRGLRWCEHKREWYRLKALDQT